MATIRLRLPGQDGVLLLPAALYNVVLCADGVISLEPSGRAHQVVMDAPELVSVDLAGRVSLR